MVPLTAPILEREFIAHHIEDVIKRSRCFDCLVSLRYAKTEHQWTGDLWMRVGYRCPNCDNARSGHFELDQEALTSARHARLFGPHVPSAQAWHERIEADELLDLHQLLDGYAGGLGALAQPSQP